MKAKWLSTKNSSTRRSTPGHPITMASTAKHPDPMPCALASILWPELRAHGCHMQKTLFPGPACTRGVSQCVLGQCLRTECAHAARAGDGSRSDVLSAGRRCLTPRVGGDSWSSCTRRGAAGGCAGAWPRGGPSGAVNDRGAESCMRGRLGWCGVRWLFPGCCSGGHLGSWAPTA